MNSNMNMMSPSVRGDARLKRREAKSPPPAATPRPSGTQTNAANEMVEVTSDSDAITFTSPEEQKRRTALAKLQPSLAAIVERLRTKQGTPNADEAKFVRNGKAEIQVFLTEKTPEVLAQLKALGFEIVLDPQSSKLVIGRISLDKLSALAELKFVRYVATQK